MLHGKLGILKHHLRSNLMTAFSSLVLISSKAIIYAFKSLEACAKMLSNDVSFFTRNSLLEFIWDCYL